MMMKIQNGNCFVSVNVNDLTKVCGVMYKGKAVWINAYHELKIGRYVKAYTIENEKPVAFGEIKFTVGTINHGWFNCNYVLCEY